jgi:hypothetical protein
MIKTFKRVFLTVASLSVLAMPTLAPAVVFAQNADINSNLCAGTNFSVDQKSGCDSAGATSKVNSILSLVINLFSLIVGFVSVVMIIIGGFKYITSGGEAANVSGAKNTIIYAIVGLVIVALAQFIVHFVLGKVTGTTT